MWCRRMPICRTCRGFGFAALLALFLLLLLALVLLLVLAPVGVAFPGAPASAMARSGAAPASAGTFAAAPAPSGLSQLGSRPVYVIRVEGTIDPGLAAYIRRSLEEARQRRAAGAVLLIGTLGGRVDAALDIRDTLLRTPLTTLAYVESRAWSAGALIAMACEKLVMAPGSSIGAAETRPAEEKYISAFRGEFSATAERRGRRADVAAAMVDVSVAIPGLDGPDQLLTLTATQARKWGIADGVAPNLYAALEPYGLAGQPQVVREMNTVERLTRWLTDPGVATLLLTIGFVGLAVELIVMGWGWPGMIGVTALILFFLGSYMAGFAGWESIALFVAGLILLAIEVFAIPGFGVTGVLGLAAMFTGIFLAFASARQAAVAIATAIGTTLVAGYLMFRYFGRIKALQRLVLSTRQEHAAGYSALPDLASLEGQEGVALTILRPAGTAEIAGRRVDVLTEGDFAQAGDRIRVIRVEGNRVVVRKVS
ncbi:MAG: nodulation protein NfeD [Firmicutes bacterium]|nr:nodulation protein NfeD [Bacillota bacterium]